MTDPIKIVKASGITENYDETKVSFSLHQAHLPIAFVNQTLAFLHSKLKEGISTQQIHELLTEYLKENGQTVAAVNYDLKRAIMRLGPSGFPFEKFLARILNRQGFRTEVGLMVAGRCVTHEIDIDAQKEGRHFLVECKYHNAPGTKTDVQVALYTYARFLDIRAALTDKDQHQNVFHQAWLVTNTKVTKDAVDYAKCLNINLVSWTYPHHGNLRDMIIEAQMYPITSLKLEPHQYQTLLQREIVACVDLNEALSKNQVSDIISNQQKENLLNQLNAICHAA